jgi:hypothetical protein
MPDPIYATFTDVEKTKIRTALGYLSAAPVASIALGVPAATQPMFLVEGAMERMLYPSGPIIRDYLCQIDAVDDQIKILPGYAVASNLGNLELREDSMEQLLKLRQYWVKKLSDILGAPMNPYSAMGGNSMNRRVVNC